MATDPQTVMILAGEASGDQHAAALVEALRRERPDLRVFGFGGPRMRAAGVETLFDISDLAVMGISEVVRRYGFFRRVFATMQQEARKRRPAAVILVDYPGFNLRFAAYAHALGLRTVYYISPQVWAWHRSRIPKMARILDRLLVIFPFEVPLFEKTRLRVDFVGHPLVDEAARTWSEPEAALPWRGSTRVALLPGSRRHEIQRLLPDMVASARLLHARCPDCSFLVATPDDAVRSGVEAILATLDPVPSSLTVVSGQTRQVLRQAHGAIVASGTATLEASLMLCPMLIVYRVSAFTYAIARRLVRIPFIGLVNIVAGKRVCPEFIQDGLRPAALAEALLPILTDAAERQRQRDNLQAVNAALGSGGAAQRAAACVIEELNRAPAGSPS